MLSRRPITAQNRGRIAVGGGADLSLDISTADEGDAVNLEFSGEGLDGATSIEAFYNGVSVGTDSSGPPWTAAFTADVPGACAITVEVDGGSPIGPATLTVSPLSPSMVSPATSAIDQGDTVNLVVEVPGALDAATTSISAYLGDPSSGGTLIGTDSAPTASQWIVPFDTTGVALAVYRIWLRRSWTGQGSGTVDTDTNVDLTVQAAGFVDPTSIAGCVMWVDMQDAAAFTESAGTITSVTNKVSSTVYNTGTLPAYAATGLNGHPCMDFDGTTHHILGTEAAVLAAMTNDAPFTLVYVGNHDASTDATRIVFGIGDPAQAANRTRSWGINNTGTGRWASNAVNNTGGLAAGATPVASAANNDANTHTFVWTYTGTTISLSLDGAAADPNAGSQQVGTLTPARFAFGARPRTTIDLFFDGQAGEYILYNSVISGGDLTDLLAYLAAKWA